ncbi:SGNH/GDSL hydrolase family protein [Affinibrenneria salicis]|uniref:SGNH/GDSL hydrolase family protein n=1 Tax=Affinibrenneria salicis TaxID=2590031 RepID=UPI001CC82B13|nr:SGNH/GDSL hydrolase family protein [Affinibrenneria salicis]
MLFSLLVSCHNDRNRPAKEGGEQENAAIAHQLTDFDEPNLRALAEKLRSASQQSIHIVQLGDSHTAADFFTGALRQQLQRRFGDGGPGFISPVAVPGQRYAEISFAADKRAWQLISSRKEKRTDFPLGGMMAQPAGEQASVILNSRRAGDSYLVQALYRSSGQSTLALQSAGQQRTLPLPATDGNWRFSSAAPAALPLNASVNQGASLQLGGWLIARDRPGVMLSALGINGATINMLDKWQDWPETLAQMKPDMVILSYGTNEAFNASLDAAQYRQNLESKIAALRRVAPQAVVLLLGPGDSIKRADAGSCQQMQPPLLNTVIQVQQAVARQQHTLFWNWRDYMGGECAIQRWASEGLARPDMVHLSQAGYEQSAQALYQQLMQILAL